MEETAQIKKAKCSKRKVKDAAEPASVRIKPGSKKKALALQHEANNKPNGRKIKLDDIFELALSLVTSEHLKTLQERSMTHEDRKEILRQKYIESRGPISKDEFTGLMMTAEFFEFLKATDSMRIVA